MKTKLWEEYLDPIEYETPANDWVDVKTTTSEIDRQYKIKLIQRIIEKELPKKQHDIILALMDGISYKKFGVTEKYWRYNTKKAIKLIEENYSAWTKYNQTIKQNRAGLCRSDS